MRFPLAALLLGPLTGPAFGQDIGGYTPGQRVRITADAAGLRRHVATVIDVTLESLTIERAAFVVASGRTRLGVDTIRLARTAISRLERSRGRRGHAGAGALVGTSVGALVGFVVGGRGSRPSSGCQPVPFDYWGCAAEDVGNAIGGAGAGVLGMLRGALGGAALGAGLGAVIGAAVRSERWVPARGTSITVRPVPGGLALAVSVPR